MLTGLLLGTPLVLSFSLDSLDLSWRYRVLLAAVIRTLGRIEAAYRRTDDCERCAACRLDCSFQPQWRRFRLLFAPPPAATHPLYSK